MTHLAESNPSNRRIIELRALLKTALEVANEIGAGEDSRPSSPVAPDSPGTPLPDSNPSYRLEELISLARAARNAAAAPDYDEEAIRDALWALVDAVLAESNPSKRNNA